METVSNRGWLEQWKQKETEVAGAVETESNRGGWSSGNRKQQRWLEQWKQKAAEVAGAMEAESSRGGWSSGNRKQHRGGCSMGNIKEQSWLEQGKWWEALIAGEGFSFISTSCKGGAYTLHNRNVRSDCCKLRERSRGKGASLNFR